MLMQIYLVVVSPYSFSEYLHLGCSVAPLLDCLFKDWSRVYFSDDVFGSGRRLVARAATYRGV